MLAAQEYALGTWEMHLWAKEEKDYICSKMLSSCRYVDTAIDYNNDYLLSDIPSETKIISKVSSYHGSKYEFFVSNHLKCLKRDCIDIMLIHSSRGDWQSVAKNMMYDNRFKEIGVSNFDVKSIEEFKNIVGSYPRYNELEINPYYTDLETIKFCKDHGIKVIAYGIFGGKYNAPTYVADFSVPYLLEYAANYADIVILKPESYRQVNELKDVILNYVSEPGERSFIPVKEKPESVNKSIEPMRYFAKDIKKYCYGYETYTNWCGRNVDTIGFKSKVIFQTGFDREVVDNVIDVPEFEMLGDYLTYLRYMFKTKYDDYKPVYAYDFLCGDNAWYIVHLFDDKGRISKINKFGKVRVTMLERQ